MRFHPILFIIFTAYNTVTFLFFSGSAKIRFCIQGRNYLQVKYALFTSRENILRIQFPVFDDNKDLKLISTEKRIKRNKSIFHELNENESFRINTFCLIID